MRLNLMMVLEEASVIRTHPLGTKNICSKCQKSKSHPKVQLGLKW